MFKVFPAAITAALLTNSVAFAAERPASCAPDHPAQIVRSLTAEYPALAQLTSVTGRSIIRVDLSDKGQVEGAYVAVSSGSGILDRAAVRTVKALVYAPETRACAATPGSYAVEVEYD